MPPTLKKVIAWREGAAAEDQPPGLHLVGGISQNIAPKKISQD